MIEEAGVPQVARGLSEDFEIEQHIRALGSSSSRVRFTMLTLVVASVAALVTLWGERPDAWARDRLQKAAHYRLVADQCGLWYDPDCAKKNTCANQLAFEDEEHKSMLFKKVSAQDARCKDAEKAFNWLSRYGLMKAEDAKAFSEKQWEYYIENILYVRTPVLGLTFDINDLGLITGTTLVFVMLVMLYSTHRAHENLVLAMWKVRELCKESGDFDRPGSDANLLYHTLAMEQVFTVPPTLARWNDFFPIRSAHYFLFFLPCFVQYLVYRNDKGSAPIGHLASLFSTDQSLQWQLILTIVVSLLSVVSVLHVFADDKEWKSTFYFINPSHRYRGKSPWRHWVQLLHSPPPAWGLVGEPHRPEDGYKRTLYFSDTVRGRIMRLERKLEAQDSGEGLFVGKLTVCCKALCRNLHRDARGNLHGALPLLGGGPGETQSEVIWSGSSFPGPKEIDLGPRFIGYLEDGDNWYCFSEDGVRKFRGDGKLLWQAGGRSHQVDGEAGEAGFHRIACRIAHEEDVFVTDGAWVRRIGSNGHVSTWGGKPLGNLKRKEPPYLLGLAYVTGTNPHLLVCDFSSRCLLRVWENKVERAYKSPRGWSPSGVWIDRGEVFLLEYRVAMWRYRLVPKNAIGPYLRIRYGFVNNLQSMSDVMSLSRWRARAAENSQEGISITN